MPSPVCISLPYLHGAPLCRTTLSMARHLWPGLPDMPGGHWQPETLPFTEDMAHTMLAELADLNIFQLETIRSIHNSMQYTGSATYLAEMADLASFAENGEVAEDSAVKIRIIYEQAQKVLLWLWLQEERLMEISSLAGRCDDFSGLLVQNFGENEPSGSSTHDAHAPDTALLPSWWVCVANAAIFLPLHTPLLAVGEMADDLWEMLEFNSYGEIPVEQGSLYCANAPLWQVTGQTGPCKKQNHPMAEIYNSGRSWLVWREE